MVSVITKRVMRLIDDRYNRQRVAVGPTTTLRSDLRMDSFDRAALQFDLEDEFGIDVGDDEFGDIDSVSEVAGLVEHKNTKG